MNPATWKTIKETFATALDLPAPERDQFLARSSDEIRGEVEKLLGTYKEAQTFINTPLIVEKGLRRNGHEESLTGKQIDDYVSYLDSKFTNPDGSVLQWSTQFSIIFFEPELGVQWRLNCTEYSSGVASYRVSQ